MIWDNVNFKRQSIAYAGTSIPFKALKKQFRETGFNEISVTDKTQADHIQDYNN